MKIKCIYCLQLKEANREHVFPEAFGLYGDSTPTLLDTVCEDCNSFFGKKLEEFFNKGSFEALLRFRHSLKDADEAGEIYKHRVVFRTTAGPMKGMLVAFSPDVKAMPARIIPVDQVGLLRSDGEGYDFFSIDHLRSFAKKKNFDHSRYNFKKAKSIAILVAKEQLDTTIALLKSIGVSLKKSSMSPAPAFNSDELIEIEISGRFDNISRRTLSKIAFNYLALKTSPDFVLSPRFNLIRKFIRYEELIGPLPVDIIERPFLHQDSNRKRQTSNHLIAIESDRNGIVAHISPFNYVHYRVVLTREPGISFSFGNAFDFDSHEIHPLQNSKLSMMKLGDAFDRPFSKIRIN